MVLACLADEVAGVAFLVHQDENGLLGIVEIDGKRYLVPLIWRSPNDAKWEEVSASDGAAAELSPAGEDQQPNGSDEPEESEKQDAARLYSRV